MDSENKPHDQTTVFTRLPSCKEQEEQGKTVVRPLEKNKGFLRHPKDGVVILTVSLLASVTSSEVIRSI